MVRRVLGPAELGGKPDELALGDRTGRLENAHVIAYLIVKDWICRHCEMSSVGHTMGGSDLRSRTQGHVRARLAHCAEQPPRGRFELPCCCQHRVVARGAPLAQEGNRGAGERAIPAPLVERGRQRRWQA